MDSVLPAVPTPLQAPASLSQKILLESRVLGSKCGWVNIQLLLSKAHWFLKGAKRLRLEELYLPASGPVEESP